jgi:protein-S-isoprenylcysteine O-methyltransferase Ste14
MSRSLNLFLLLVAPVLAVVLALLGLETLDRNLLGWVLLALGIAYPAVTIAYYGIRKHLFWEGLGEVLQQEQGDRSFWAVMPGMLVVFFASPLEFQYLSGEPAHPFWLQLAGLALVVLGILLGLWARMAAGRRYSAHLQVMAGQALVTTGPYGMVRHPAYGAYILLTLGVAVGYLSIIGLAAVALLVLPGLLYRIKVEEDILKERFGDQYRNYQHHVKALIPGIW